MREIIWSRCLSCATFMPLDGRTGRCPCCAWDTSARRRLRRRRPHPQIVAESAQYTAFALLVAFIFLGSALIQIVMVTP